MYLVKAGTFIQIEVPKSIRDVSWEKWTGYQTKEDKVYDKHEVWDLVAVHNGREVPLWAVRNIQEHNKVVICRNGKYAMVNPSDIEFLN